MRSFRDVLIAGWVLVVAVIYVIQYRFQFDLWQHLACGREIMRSGHILTIDTFTHTIAGQPFIDQNWLAQIIFYGVYALGGLPLLTLFVSSLYAAALMLISYCCWKRSQHYLASILCGVLALWLGIENMSMRPQVFSAVFLAAELYVLWFLSDSWKPIAVALIILLWTNCHGAFTLGIGLPGILFIGAALTNYQAGRNWRKAAFDPSARSYLLCVTSAVVVSFCNPHPAQTFSYVAKNMAISIMLEVGEWQPVSVNSVMGIAFLASIIGAIVVLNRSRSKLNATDLMLLVIFLYFALKALRMISWWGFVLAPILAAPLALLIRDLPESRAKLRPLLLYIVVVMLTTATLLPLAKKLELMGPNEEPVGLIAFLKKSSGLGRVYNTLEMGGCLMWYGEDKLKVFIDGRVDPFPTKVFRDYLMVKDGCENWNEILKQYNVDSIVASKFRNPRLVYFAGRSKEWKEAYSDPLVIVFRRLTQ